jgi:hypothetical protein
VYVNDRAIYGCVVTPGIICAVSYSLSACFDDARLAPVIDALPLLVLTCCAQDGVSDVNTHNALVYRSGQKRLARGYLLAAQTELQHVMRELARRG